MRRVVVLVLGMGAAGYLGLVLFLYANMVLQGQWLRGLTLSIPGLGFGGFLLWLGMTVARGRHMYLASGILGFFGISTAMGTMFVYLYGFGRLPSIILLGWTAYLLTASAMILLAARASRLVSSG